MINKAIFLDRDGTINVDKGYIHKIEDLEILPNVIEGLKKLYGFGYKLIIITNQSGIGRGYYTEENYFALRDEMHKRLKNQGVLIIAEYFCPHNPEDNCKCRKPKTGMLEQAAKDFNLDLKECWMIGDKSLDIAAGKNAGCRTIHILTGHITSPLKEANFFTKDMIEAADYILHFQ
jgi:D,D-heptose 1,7-bisphosphate phosphatase